MSIVDYLLFDDQPEVDGGFHLPDGQVNDDLLSLLFPSSGHSEFYLPPGFNLCGPSSLLSDGAAFVTAAVNPYTDLTGAAANPFPEKELDFPPPESFAPAHFQSPVGGAATAGGEKPGGGGCPSAQSAAARQRRKRISEKTQELGHLIPGAGRMNTAEMLQTAFKYVKFLQAQIGMLDLAGSFSPEDLRERRSAPWGEAEPSLQEKLAAVELCVVPTMVLLVLSEDRGILSRPSIARELRCVLLH
ncbi:unnamed protein product [Spirodela intermedia]|uniref:BHLH domain-containing protein n=2 Tax=Spirodela intermedia TaxID=51605 RepID=A0A7I8IFM6_SPIIN|nr:unnamed protein product [Spirodela intermedia]CAA6656431.1 unnamed protein product [Spirodela intermedia]CAA7392004.1 unnamed protein product [Spirodela intermedia]